MQALRRYLSEERRRSERYSILDDLKTAGIITAAIGIPVGIIFVAWPALVTALAIILGMFLLFIVLIALILAGPTLIQPANVSKSSAVPASTAASGPEILISKFASFVSTYYVPGLILGAVVFATLTPIAIGLYLLATPDRPQTRLGTMFRILVGSSLIGLGTGVGLTAIGAYFTSGAVLAALGIATTIPIVGQVILVGLAIAAIVALVTVVFATLITLAADASPANAAVARPPRAAPPVPSTSNNHGHAPARRPTAQSYLHAAHRPAQRVAQAPDPQFINVPAAQVVSASTNSRQVGEAGTTAPDTVATNTSRRDAGPGKTAFDTDDPTVPRNDSQST